MIKAKIPDWGFTSEIEAHMNSLPFMPSRGQVTSAIHELMIDAYKSGYLRGVSDEITGNLIMEDS